jgi:GntR family transcriptional repressor for pyruvate dehydrogenase complex
MLVTVPRSVRLHAQIVDDLVGRIVSGELPPGSTLAAEPEMSARYGVSRTVIREALRVLDGKGLIDVRHGSGTRVTPPDRWDPLDMAILAIRRERGQLGAVLADLIEARRIIECEVAALAAQRHDATQRAVVESQLVVMRATLEDPKRYMLADAAFHDTLVAASGNRVLMRMMEPIHELVHFGQMITDAIPGTLLRALHDHESIAAAVFTRDPSAAHTAMRAHLDRTERDITSLVQTPETR